MYFYVSMIIYKYIYGKDFCRQRPLKYTYIYMYIYAHWWYTRHFYKGNTHTIWCLIYLEIIKTVFLTIFEDFAAPIFKHEGKKWISLKQIVFNFHNLWWIVMSCDDDKKHWWLSLTNFVNNHNKYQEWQIIKVWRWCKFLKLLQRILLYIIEHM